MCYLFAGGRYSGCIQDSTALYTKLKIRSTNTHDKHKKKLIKEINVEAISSHNANTSNKVPFLGTQQKTRKTRGTTEAVWCLTRCMSAERFWLLCSVCWLIGLWIGNLCTNCVSALGRSVYSLFLRVFGWGATAPGSRHHADGGHFCGFSLVARKAKVGVAASQ